MSSLETLQTKLTHDIRHAEYPENILDILETAFPELKKTMPKSEWLKHAREFFRNTPIKTPIIHEISDLFVEYLYKNSDKKWFELAHYEWVEVALFFDSTDLKKLKTHNNPDFTQDIPIISPLAYLLSYEISNPGYYIAYRNYDHDVFYEPINIFSAKLFELLKNNNILSGQAILEKLAENTHHTNPKELLSNGLNLLHQWHHKNIIL